MLVLFLQKSLLLFGVRCSDDGSSSKGIDYQRFIGWRAAIYFQCSLRDWKTGGERTITTQIRITLQY